MINFQKKDSYDWADLIEIIGLLRSPQGCPWDREQTHLSIRRDFLEETYEALDALDRDDPAAMKEELGDVLLQVVFHAQIEEERGRFTADDVVNAIAQKMVYRHPHVFGGQLPEGGWEELKRQEKGQQSTAEAIEAVPHTLPALWRGEKIQKKAAKAGFDWNNPRAALEKLEEEVRELRAALEQGTEASVMEELGDVLFSAVKIAQTQGLDPEESLHRACDKFQNRYRLVEAAAERPLTAYTQEELIALWTSAKKQLQEEPSP